MATKPDPINLLCLKCGNATDVEWEGFAAGRKLILRSCRCGSIEFRLSGGANGIISSTCARFSSNQLKLLDGYVEEVWDSLCVLLDALRVRMGSGRLSERFCLMCEERLHSPSSACTCPCHPSRLLRSRLEADMAAKEAQPASPMRNVFEPLSSELDPL